MKEKSKVVGTKSLSHLAHSSSRHTFSTSSGQTGKECVLLPPWAGWPSARPLPVTLMWSYSDVTCPEMWENLRGPKGGRHISTVLSVYNPYLRQPLLVWPSCLLHSLSAASSISWNRPLPGLTSAISIWIFQVWENGGWTKKILKWFSCSDQHRFIPKR